MRDNWYNKKVSRPHDEELGYDPAIKMPTVITWKKRKYYCERDIKEQLREKPSNRVPTD